MLQDQNKRRQSCIWSTVCEIEGCLQHRIIQRPSCLSRRILRCEFSKMATISDEYDEARSILPKRFCRQIFKKEYNNASARATKQALQDFIADLEKNPQQMHKVLRRKKEQTLPFLETIKVKAMKVFDPGYMHTVYPESQCEEHLNKMKKGLISTFNYAQGLSLITVTKSMD